MASSKEYLQFILEQLSDLEEINFRAMTKEVICKINAICGFLYWNCDLRITV